MGKSSQASAKRTTARCPQDSTQEQATKTLGTGRNAGLADGFATLWVHAWLPSWAIAFPVVLVVAPLARRLVNLAVR